YLANGLSLCGLSVPSFWLGIMLILFFSVRLGWLPASGFVSFVENPAGNLTRMLMPACGLGTTLASVLMRQTRNSMIEVLTADYIRTAYSKGLAGRAVIFRHAIRNGLIPVVTILGLQMGALMGGAVVTEQIFVVPGFGRLIVESVFTRDYLLVLGAPWIAPADPLRTDRSQIRKAPSAAHPLGTDDLGRDVLSRVIWGTRISMQAGVFSILLAIVIGVPAGLVAGFYRGAFDQ